MICNHALDYQQDRVADNGHIQDAGSASL